MNANNYLFQGKAVFDDFNSDLQRAQKKGVIFGDNSRTTTSCTQTREDDAQWMNVCDVVPAYEKGGSFELSDQALFLRSSEEDRQRLCYRSIRHAA